MKRLVILTCTVSMFAQCSDNRRLIDDTKWSSWLLYKPSAVKRDRAERLRREAAQKAANGPQVAASRDVAPAYPASMQGFYGQRTSEARQARKQALQERAVRLGLAESEEAKLARREAILAAKQAARSDIEAAERQGLGLHEYRRKMEREKAYGMMEPYGPATTPEMIDAYEQWKPSQDKPMYNETKRGSWFTMPSIPSWERVKRWAGYGETSRAKDLEQAYKERPTYSDSRLEQFRPSDVEIVAPRQEIVLPREQEPQRTFSSKFFPSYKVPTVTTGSVYTPQFWRKIPVEAYEMEKEGYVIPPSHTIGEVMSRAQAPQRMFSSKFSPRMSVPMIEVGEQPEFSSMWSPRRAPRKMSVEAYEMYK